MKKEASYLQIKNTYVKNIQKRISQKVPTKDFPFDNCTKRGLNGLVKIPQADANGSPNPKYKTLINKIFLSGRVNNPEINTPVKK